VRLFPPPTCDPFGEDRGKGISSHPKSPSLAHSIEKTVDPYSKKSALLGSHFSECDCCKPPWLNGSLHSSGLLFPGVDLRTAKLCGLDVFQPLHPVSQAGAAHRHMKGELCRFVYYWVAVFQVVPALRFLCEMTLKLLVLEPFGSCLVLCELPLRFIPSEKDLKSCSLIAFFNLSPARRGRQRIVLDSVRLIPVCRGPQPSSLIVSFRSCGDGASSHHPWSSFLSPV
jgi:hypothetical protein